MEDYEYKNLQGAALQKRWENLAAKEDWESILQLTTERLNYLYENLKQEGTTKLKKEEALTRVFVANTICACHSLLKLIKTLDRDVYKELIETNADERIEALDERIKSLEAKE